MDGYDSYLPAPGDLIADTYRVEGVIGQGGMGVVLAATHTGSNERVAIKFLLPAASEYPDIVERFAREARAAMRIRGPHVARVSEVGTLDDGRAFMVMEHLQGCDLRAALQVHGALPLEEAALHVLEALEAIAEAHAKGVVHRDLKPANLFLADQPDGSTHVKVLDFGISKLKDDGNALTKTFDVVGTPYYMAPEQLTNAKNVDERADIWSVGIILYELLTAKRPFDGRSMAEIISRVLGNRPTPPSEVRPELPKAIDAIVARCLASDRDDRYEDVGELAEELAPFAGAAGAALAVRVVAARDRANTERRPKAIRAASAPAARSGAPSAAASPTVTTAAPAAPLAAPKPARSVAAAVSLLVLVLLVAAAAWFWNQKTHTLAAPLPSPETH